jgi:hypothetical protein
VQSGGSAAVAHEWPHANDSCAACKNRLACSESDSGQRIHLTAQTQHFNAWEVRSLLDPASPGSDYSDHSPKETTSSFAKYENSANLAECKKAVNEAEAAARMHPTFDNGCEDAQLLINIHTVELLPLRSCTKHKRTSEDILYETIAAASILTLRDTALLLSEFAKAIGPPSCPSAGSEFDQLDCHVKSQIKSHLEMNFGISKFVRRLLDMSDSKGVPFRVSLAQCQSLWQDCGLKRFDTRSVCDVAPKHFARAFPVLVPYNIHSEAEHYYCLHPYYKQFKLLVDSHVPGRASKKLKTDSRR